MAIEFGKGITLASGFDLGSQAPLDSRLTVATIEERDAHVTGNRAYDGMLVFVEADKVTYQYVIRDGVGAWEVFGFNEEDFLAHVANDLETDDAGKALAASQGVTLKGLIDAEAERAGQAESDLQGAIDELAETVGQLPEGTSATSVVDYVNIKTAGIATDAALEELNNQVAGLQTAVQDIQEDYLVEADKTELANAIAAEAELARAAEKANADAIEILNSNETVDGSVDKKVKDAINAFATKISENGTIDTFKELVDYVGTHGGEAGEMAAAIDILEGLVGDKAVATQITEAIAAENLAQYATDDELAEAIARIVVVEGKAHEHANLEILNGITAEKVAAWDASEQNAKDYVDEKLAEEVTARNEAITTAKDEVVDYVDTEIAKDRARLDAIENEETGILKQAKDYADEKIGDVDLSGIATNAGKITALEEAVSTKAAQSDLELAVGRIDGLDEEVAKIGEVESGKTIVMMLEELRASASAQANDVLVDAKKYTDEEIAKIDLSGIQANADEIAVIKEAITEGGSVMEAIAAARANAESTAKDYTDAEIVKVNASITALSDAHTADKTTLEGADNALADRASVLEGKVEALEAVKHEEISQEEIEAMFPEQA